jgi:hypothetical protein
VNCVHANVSAGRCVNGSEPTCSRIGFPSLTTSVIARNFIGADAWSINQVSGNFTGGDGAAAAGVSGGAIGLGLTGVVGGGSVTERSLRA